MIDYFVIVYGGQVWGLRVWVVAVLCVLVFAIGKLLSRTPYIDEYDEYWERRHEYPRKQEKEGDG